MKKRKRKHVMKYADGGQVKKEKPKGLQNNAFEKMAQRRKQKFLEYEEKMRKKTLENARNKVKEV